MAYAISPLVGLDYFQSGVGDGDDLKVSIREDLDGGWYPVFRTGYFYLSTQESYLYSQPGEYLLSAPTAQTSGRVTIGTGQFTVEPTQVGPVRLERESTAAFFQRVASPLKAFRETTFTLVTSGGDLRQATVPGLLIQLCSHPVSGVYLSVPSTGDIVSHEDYVYEPRTGKVYIRDSSPPTLYATYLVPETYGDQLRQEEILVVDSDRKVRTQLTHVLSGSPWTPLIRKPTRTGTVSTTASVVSGNVLSFTASGIASGDVVAVEYYVGDSFTAYTSGTSYLDYGLVVQYLPMASGSCHVRYEAGLGEVYDASQLYTGHINKVQLNPLLEPVESGFLFIADEDEAWPDPARIEVHLSNHNPTTLPAHLTERPSSSDDLYWWTAYPHVLLTVKVLDAEGDPVPATQVTVSISGVTGHLATYRSKLERTYNTGEITYGFVPFTAGTATVTVTANDAPTVTGGITFPVWEYTEFDTSSELALGKLFLHVENHPYVDESQKLADGLYRVNAYFCYPDGVPYQPDVASTTPWVGHVKFSTQNSPMFTLDGKAYISEEGVEIGPTGIATILVKPKAGDVLQAYVEVPVTSGGTRRRHARPLHLTEILPALTD